MPPLTIENFEINKLRAKAPKIKKGGNLTYYAIPIEYEDGEPPLKIDDNFRMFKHTSENGTSYSLAISVNNENEEFFSKLEDTISELACEWKTKFSKIRSLKPSDLKLIKTNVDSKYRDVYARIYTNKYGKVNCSLSERKKVNGVYKRKRISIDD